MKVIIHSSVSLDGSLLGFAVDMRAHYRIVGSYGADVHLVGSNTAAAGLKMFFTRLPREKKSDFVRPTRDKSLPLWVIPDSKGKLLGKLHILRRFDLCRDIVILATRATPKKYLRYLKERDYVWHRAEKSRVDYRQALRWLAKEHAARTIITDTGKILNGILLDNGMVDEISLLVHPVLVGKKCYPLLGNAQKGAALRLKKCRPLAGGKTWLVYKVMKGHESST